jgi:UDP-N-acetylmuramoylalanine--D-glutamate ligase
MGQLTGQSWVVVGLGKSGAAASQLLLNRGALVTCFDEGAKAQALAHPNFSLKRGPLLADFWRGATGVVVSPGVPLSKPEVAQAIAAGAPVFGEIELALRFLPPGAGFSLGITGTNGKSTTTALLGELMARQLPKTFVGGNLGTALTLAYADPSTPPYACHVVELSSFQLEGLTQGGIRGAAFLNLTPDHLDRYASHEAYGEAKARIFDRQPSDGFAVVNADDAHVVRLSERARVPRYGFSLGNGSAAGFAGMAVAEAGSSTFSLTHTGDRFTVNNRALRGSHNLANAMAASLMAQQAGVSAATIQTGLDAFAGLPHRMESVRTLNQVEFINDSKATNVDSSLVALAALRERVWLIAGGKGKGAPYTPLVSAAKAKVVGVLTIGSDAPNIEAAFAGQLTVVPCQTLERAVEKARQLASPGDVVLLSPACASYDQFDHFEHRGDTFKALVRAL